MSTNTENIVKKCEVVVDSTNNVQENHSKSSNTLKSVRKKIRNFTIRRKADEKLKSDDQNDNREKISDETLGKSKITLKKIFRKSSFKKFINNIQNFTNFTTNNAKNDRVPPINNYTWPPDSIPGVIGLRNHGNTCFMNAVLQCLSHTDILAEYFVLDQYKADLRKRNKINSRKFGTKGELTEQLALVLKALWTCKDASEYSTNFKEVVERYGAQFRSSTQHDAQEFLFWLLDKVHEDLNTAKQRKYKSIKNNYGRPDEVIAAETLANYMRCNNSFVQAVFRAQFRSSLTCPRCHKQSNTFDPFHCISVQLPQLSLQSVIVNVLYDNKTPTQVRMAIGVPQGSSVLSLREKIHLETDIDEKRMVLTEASTTGFGRLFCDSHPSSNIGKDENVLCIELPDKIEDSQIALCIMNVKVNENDEKNSFGSVFCMKINRDVTFSEFQKALLKQMSGVLKPEVFSYATPINEMFKIHLQEPSADPGTYLEEKFEHPLLTDMIDLALSVQPTDSGPLHIKLSLEWPEPEKYFIDMEDHFVEHESIAELKEKASESNELSLEQCLDHYTKAETLSAEDAWRCPQCQKYLPVVKTLGLWSLPDILVIHFKRFRQQQFKGSHASKLTTMVNFPLTGFDLSTWHLANGINGSSSVNSTLTRRLKPSKMGSLTKTNLNEDHRYDLYAVCYHQGDTLETGHYTAACKNPYDQQWYKFDDQRVSLIKNEEVSEKIINNEAYMLFYQRRKNGDNCDSSGASTSSSEHWVSKIAPAPVVTTKSATKVSTDEESSEDEFSEVIPADNKVTIQVEISSCSPSPEIAKLTSPVHFKDKNSNDVVSEIQKRSEESDKIEELMSQHTINNLLWNDANNNSNRHSDVGAITISDLLSMDRIDEISSTSLPKNYMLQDCEPIPRRIRGVSSCSKDTLLYIDQQGMLEDESLLENRAHWISPVTPHKLITVSPKN
ncbi:CLUMA_CG009523, isoform A [Clunio marinus]|uniref:Ubiquitin carboxyl-terminal hydrolase n=1 Tax=Clunio marinus TaxID=568069 RepID=A0A1J1I702_9DIPT|nr:CLUMA_CG009523, isoform A [Clunio marinus]